MPRLRWTYLLLPLQLSIFLLLHILYGLYRVVNHLRHRPTATADDSRSLESDVRRWQAHKIPKHLAAAFTPGPRKFFSKGKQQTRRRQLVEDVRLLVGWCLKTGIERLSVYDAQGTLAICADDLAAAFEEGLFSNRFALKRHSSTHLSITCSSTQGSLQLRMLGPQDGKPFLAHLTRELGTGWQRRQVQAEDIDVPLVQHKMASAGYDEPQLLIVLGGYLLQLRNMPPWQIRLTEIYHEPSLELLGPSRLSYSTYRKALDAFAQCEMRFGR